MSEKSSPSKDDRNGIANSMQEIFGWYMKWMRSLPESDFEWDQVITESRDLYEKYAKYTIIQNVLIEMVHDLERWSKENT
jgi:hypothetical protein